MNQIQTYNNSENYPNIQEANVLPDKKPIYVRIPVGIVKIIGLVLWFFIKPIITLLQNIGEWILSKFKLILNTITDTIIKYVVKYAILSVLIFLTYVLIRNDLSFSKTFSLETWYYAISIFK